MELWKYTDDVVVGVIMGVWAFGKIVAIITSTEITLGVETEYMTLCLGYVFGNIIQKAKVALG